MSEKTELETGWYKFVANSCYLVIVRRQRNYYPENRKVFRGNSFGETEWSEGNVKVGAKGKESESRLRELAV